MLGLDGGDDVTLTMDEPHPTSLLDSGVQDVIGKPLSRVDGPKKVSGQATYAAEYRLDDMAYGVLVGATVGKGIVASIDADAVRSIPGVIDVVTDFDTFIRVSQQGGETEAPTQGVKHVEYFGQIVAIVIGESFEAARDAAARLPITYERGAGDFAFSMDMERDGDLPENNIPAHSEQGDLAQAMRTAAVTVDATYTTPSQNSAAMEPHASIADVGRGRRADAVWRIPDADLRRAATRQIGSALPRTRCGSFRASSAAGFGSKLGIAPESVAAAIAAKHLGPPGQGGDDAPAGVRCDGAPVEHVAADAAGGKC